MKTEIISARQFKFWKENKTDQEFELTIPELVEKLKLWIATKEKDWLEYYSSGRVIRAFIIDKEGLNSVFEENDFEEIFDALQSIILDYLYPKSNI